MEATHNVKFFINGDFVLEYSAFEMNTGKVAAKSYCRIEEDGQILATKGMAFVDRTEEVVHINFSYDIFFFDLYSCESIEKNGSYYYKCHSKALGNNVEVFICADDLTIEEDNYIHEYFGV